MNVRKPMTLQTSFAAEREALVLFHNHACHAKYPDKIGTARYD
jgi:hypothetical protein